MDAVSIIAHVDGVTSSVARSRGVCITNFWNAHTACTVFWPYTPSCGPGSKRIAERRCCRRNTSSPFIPGLMVRVSGTVTTGTVVCSSVESELPFALSFWLSLARTPNATTVMSTANATSAGLQRSYVLCGGGTSSPRKSSSYSKSPS